MKDAAILSINGGSVIVDAEDVERLSTVTWRVGGKGYAERTVYLGGGRSGRRTQHIKMHREILGAGPGDIVDHINRDRLDNRKSNLRLVSRAENARNRGPNCNNTSGYKGVYWRGDVGKWLAMIQSNRIQHYLGYYTSREQAAEAYNAKALDLFGPGAYLNEIKEDIA